MMCIFFIGIGCASILTSLASSPFQIGVGLFLIGVFAAIYHPVGLAIVTMKWRDTGIRIAANGVWGNLGVASAALLTGYLVDNSGWRSAFVLPGMFSMRLALPIGTCARAIFGLHARPAPDHRQTTAKNRAPRSLSL